MDITDFLIEFTNTGRVEVFKSIYKSNRRHSDLERELDIPGPEVSRNLKRLKKKNLIVKTINNEYKITSLGILFYEIVDICEKILEFKDFFNDHDVNTLPLNLILQLGKLTPLNIDNQTMANIERWSDLVKNSEEFIIAISEQFQESILPIIEKKLTNQAINIKTIIDISILKESTKVGKIFKDRHDVYDKMDAFQNVRVLEDVGISLLATDKGSILFLSKGEKIDYSQGLHSESHSFIQWTKELFHWYWQKAKKLDAFVKK